VVAVVTFGAVVVATVVSTTSLYSEGFTFTEIVFPSDVKMIVVSAVLLHKFGMSPEYITADYLKSKDNLESALKSYAEKNPQVDINVITPQNDT
jgi:uncharacterized protein involved in high-affinity Fe2+ transport